MEIIIPKTKIDKQLRRIYLEVLKPIKSNIIDKSLNIGFNCFISYGRLHFRYMPDYFDKKVEQLKNNNPNTFGEKIENTTIGCGTFSGTITGFLTSFMIYYQTKK